jgi:hypothetical protein
VVSHPTESHIRWDFFISYTNADRPWAEWIAWVLEAEGYTVFLAAWDIPAGKNFIAEMDEALRGSGRTLLVMSRAALEARYVKDEWTAAHKHDRLTPVRIEDFDVEGLLGPVAYIDFVGRPDAAACTEALLAGVSKGRAKPDTTPAWPGPIKWTM